MSGIPTETLQELRHILLECEEYFAANASLRDLFSEDTIRPFRTGLPERDSLNGRIEATIAHLLPKKRSDGRPALPLFLLALSQRYDPADERHLTLQTLATQLTPAPLLPRPPAPPPSWHTANIRALLTAALNDQSLTALAFDHFRAAHADFSDGLTRSHKIQILLDYCLRHNQVEPLLQQLERLNPSQYRQHQPYQ